MKKKKVIKIVGWFALSSLVITLSVIGYIYYFTKYKFIPSENVFTESVAYIDRATALGDPNFRACDEEHIYDYYNPQRATYSKGKNGLRDFIMSHYENRAYTDSGYLNIRFVVNCNGEAGRYVIHENNLNLEPIVFSEDLVNQLYDITTQLKRWNPNVIREEKRDSYMYISYRIENGEITEILP
ncbi:hypothetical protein EAX61_09785 [Dokdonia sinensis]|uniref:TonB C-terminal domain-containing protein n=1 Tax=Dokdonia sinensis TaxID=2479847 RepID=A0A3M0G0T7_9FLAO|nr:hypothetical protein [Dokdonia sinensis]RMB58581.1 hypothetical protein EAX61_09785 [Dokdonia sinensis]